MNRRRLLQTAIAAGTLAPSSTRATGPIHISDMHFHSFFGASINHSRPVAKSLADGGATLVSWSVAGDALWMDPKTYRQSKEQRPGEALGWVEREIGRIKAHSAEQGLKLALTAADVERAEKGEPHIVLSIEGANFIEGDASRVKRAYDLGVRHLQLVHFTANTLGDFQTEAPVHGGLTETGRQVVAECNRLGILVDLAHAAGPTVTQTLAVAKAPLVWSHGSVKMGAAAPWNAVIWRARQLPLDLAKAIAAKGGVVGLWALSFDVGKTIDGYGNRMLELADWLGDRHVAFGTDINGLSGNAAIRSYVDLRAVVSGWQTRKVPEARIRRLASENYARVLKEALVPARG
ncbi:MAG TPA: membrane dipeptidase [Hyphomicrobiaceae bacterium]|nr:membrane dipeptidase [Hyphomicrobiaceae bacterium]